jgi:membrane protease YdiL (CAAX protease family)
MGLAVHALLRRSPLRSFFILAYVISWVLWLPLVYGRFALGWTSWEGNVWTNGRTMLGILGALGPSIAAFLMTHLLEGSPGVKALLRRCVQWRASLGWWALALYGWWAVASAVAATMGLAPLAHIGLQSVFAVINIPVIIAALQMPLLLGAAGEEAGWRGFALPRLQERFGPLGASLVLALFWALWHVPLAVFPAWTGDRPLLAFAGRYLLLAVPLTLVFTWFFERVGRSVLLAVVLHRSLNLTTNAYATALGLPKDSGSLVMNGLTVVLWLSAAAIAAYLCPCLARAKR